MGPKDHGLTVGQLTMTIGALLIATLIWTTMNKKSESQQDISHAHMNSSIIKEVDNFL